MEEGNIQKSIRYLPPYEGESFSHYLGRWMRKESVNISSSSHLSSQLRFGTNLYRWERFYFNPPPSDEDLEILASIMDLELERLKLLFPSGEEKINCDRIRLCAACYKESPYHRLAWQYDSTAGCEIHRLRLLSRCICCEESFPIPVLWKGKCKRCKLPFQNMKTRQKAY